MQVFLYDAVRTARGKARPEGGLTSKKPDELVAELIQAMESRKGPIPTEALLVGAVVQSGAQGGNVALVSKFRADLPDETSAVAINNYCVSGLTAIGQAASMVASGQAKGVLAGGVEMMSHVPFMSDAADYYTDETLPARSRYLLPAVAADRLAEDLGITRSEMDEAALLSQSRAIAAEGTALNASRIEIAGLDREECPRAATTESLAKLEPAFGKLLMKSADIIGREVVASHTLAHAPPMSDGAGMALVGSEDLSDVKPRARIVAWAESGGDPAASLTAGFTAMDRVLEKADMSLVMEAFAVTISKFYRDYKPDMSKVNVGGGHLAKGHPLGASGAMLVSALLDALDEADGKYGLVTITGAAGTGSAMIVERLI